jgi:pimeloyl-ACP methyl ester carboxylesterase
MAASENIVVERGADPSHLVVSFAGKVGDMTVRRQRATFSGGIDEIAFADRRAAFDFWDLTGTIGSSRILVRDPWGLWYQKGIGRDVRSFPALVELLRRHIEELAPARVTMIGTSMGGYAAILAGHVLGVDEVHAFATQVSIHPVRMVRARDGLIRTRALDLLPLLLRGRDLRALLDLAPLLARHNGRTRYFLHTCGNCRDERRADVLAAHPGVHVLRYPCRRPEAVYGDHLVKPLLFEMTRSGYLKTVLRRDPTETPVELHTRIYDGRTARTGAVR